MSHHYSHLQSSIAILQLYKPGEPFVHFIKKYFSLHKKFGSKDRKKISALCYCYFRTYHLLKHLPMEEAIVTAYFLCENVQSAFLEEQAPLLYEKVALNAIEKLDFLGLDGTNLFPYTSMLATAINGEAFALSFLHQPFLFLRIRPGKHSKVMASLQEANIFFQEISTNTLAIENGKTIPDTLKPNRDFVIQDASSQKVFDIALENSWLHPANKNCKVWDCCAASGGKSLLMYDLLNKNIQLTVSDIRKNILHNLQQRLQDAGIVLYKTFVADLEDGASAEVESVFDVVICDAPCTGSGTWSRTPEQLAFFDENSLAIYSEKQRSIATNAAVALKPGGLFFYITCSVFEKENEGVVHELAARTNMKIVDINYINGYQHRADSMFVAILKK
jgi:16S rRNA (cytosine967-C5)-methyltransferase